MSEEVKIIVDETIEEVNVTIDETVEEVNVVISESSSDFSGSYEDLTDKPVIPSSTSELVNDSGFITGYTVTQSDVTQYEDVLSITESQISDLTPPFSGDYNDLSNQPTIPANTSDLINDSGFITGSTSPAGNNGDIQFNNNGEFGSSSKFILNNGKLGIGTETPQSKVHIVLDGNNSTRESLIIEGSYGTPFGDALLEIRQTHSGGNTHLINATVSGTKVFSVDNEGDLNVGQSINAGLLYISGLNTYSTFRSNGNNGFVFKSAGSVPDRGQVNFDYGADGQRVLTQNNRNWDGIKIRRDIDCQNNTNETGYLLNLERNVENATSENGHFMKWSDDTLGDLGIITREGKLGVGTITPSKKIHFKSNSIGDGLIVENTQSDSAIYIKGIGDTNNTFSITKNAGVDGLLFRANTDIFGFDGNLMTLLRSGNVGIGTITPTEKLEINGKIKATNINFSGLPTSSTGLITGDVWNDNGILKIIS